MTSSTSENINALLNGKLQIPVDTALQVHQTSNNNKEKNVVFCDGTWWLPNLRPTTARHDFEQGPRIPGAVFIDIDDLAAPPPVDGLSLPHMMPPPELWSAYMNAHGIRNDQHLIVYGQASNCPYIYRALVQILSMGHDANRLHLLQGSLQDWIAAGGPVDTNPVTVPRAASLTAAAGDKTDGYQASPPQAIVDMAEIRRLVKEKDDTKVIIDARPPERFYGRVNEPRPGLQLGHIPGSKNIFFMDLLQAENPIRLKPRNELQVILADYLQEENGKTIISTCGSGATACVLKAALMECGRDPNTVQIYDGSWCEWGAYPENPVVKDD